MRVVVLVLLLAGVGVVCGDTVRVECLTTQGPITIEVHPEWSPLGAERYLELVRAGFWTDIGLFRSVKNFLVQFGITGDPSKREDFARFKHSIKDDPHRADVPVREGYLSYAGSGPNSRTTQIFIAYKDLAFLGKSPWETPFGKVVEGMDNVHRFYTGYGDKPNQGRIHARGNKYLHEEYPKLDYIQSCKEVPSAAEHEPDPTPAPRGKEEEKAGGHLRGKVVGADDEIEAGKLGPLTWLGAVVVFVAGAVIAYTRRTGKSPGEAA
eukprot:Hpha_TRINITY_DN15976_c0_g1::TRINITY_DN15976_c0_g1_i1::g.73892::m.73892